MSRIGSRPNRLGIRVFASSMMRPTAIRIVSLHEVEVALAFGRAQVGHRALINAMRTDDDPALRGLPEHFGEPHHRHGAR
jgi:hypothetical protein